MTTLTSSRVMGVIADTTLREDTFLVPLFFKTPPRALNMVKSTQIARLDGMQLPLRVSTNY